MIMPVSADVSLDSIRDIRLYQSKTGYRFSVDALLLYSFVSLQRVASIADLGSGSGIVGILLAKKYPSSQVSLFEIQEPLARLARKNVALNHLEDRIQVMNCDLRNIPAFSHAKNMFDLVVSNPPFRRARSGRINVDEERAVARHEIKLKLDELLDVASILSRAKGRVCIIYHPNRLSELMDILKKYGMETKRLRFVHSNISTEAKMVLIEAVKGGRTGLKVEKPLYIYEENGNYTTEMKEIYGE